MLHIRIPRDGIPSVVMLHYGLSGSLCMVWQRVTAVRWRAGHEENTG